MTKIIFILSLFLVIGTVQAANIYVDDSNTTAPWNGTEAHPFKRIQDGINAAKARDTVLVENGMYSGTGNVNLDFGGKGILVKSKNGATNCVIECGHAMYVRGFIFQSGETASSMVDGFTIQNGLHDLGGAIHCKNASSPTIDNCVIKDNKATSGGGISCLNGSNPTILDSTIKDNTATYGGGIYCSNAAPTITGSAINNNVADNGGGVFYIAGSTGKIAKNSLLSNTAIHDGGGIYCDAASPEISENDFIWNSGDWHGAGIACYNDAAPTIYKNKIQGGKDASWGGGIYCYKSRPKIMENAIYGNTSGNGGGGIYIDQCTSAALSINGNTISENTSGDGGGINCYESTGLVINQNQVNSNKANNNGGGIWIYKGSTPDITNNTVKSNSSTKNGGGIYCSGSAPLISGNTIESNTATQKGGGIFALHNDKNPAIVENTIKSNQADHGAGIFCYTSDPLIKNNTIENNAAIQAAGGIQCNDSKPRIDSNILKGNSCAAYGGSTIVCVQSSPDIVNNLIIGNSDNAFEGGTLYFGASSNPNIISNTIVGNSTKFGGSGIYLTGSSATVQNNILWNNSSPEIFFDDFGGPSFISVAHSDVKGGQANGIDTNNNGSMTWYFSNINTDPVFMNSAGGDYHLKLGSPCIGKGGMLSGTPNKDIENNPRPNPTGSNPDMGAYESQLSGLPDILITPASWDYGDVAVGGQFDKTILVSNTGSGSLDVTATNLTGSGDFTIQSGGGSFKLNPGSTRNVVVRFKPSSTGGKSGTLSLVNNVAGKSPLNISLAGNGTPTPTPQIVVEPATWEYGEVALGNHSDKIFIVANTGSGLLNVTGTNLSGDSDFSIEAGGGSFSLNPGQMTEIAMRFTPAQALLRSAILSLTHNATGSPVDIDLQGTGVANPVPNIQVEPLSLDYGDVDVGLYVQQFFAVINTGSGPLDILTTSITGSSDFYIGDGAGHFSLNPGEVSEIRIDFAPTSQGVKNAIFSIENNVPVSTPLEVPLQGMGVVVTKPDIEVGPESWNYGEVAVGIESVIPFTVINPGSDVLEVSSVNVFGDSDFHIVSGGQPFNLNPGGEWVIKVSFVPISSGPKEAMLKIGSNVDGKTPYEIYLTGTGVTAGEPDIVVEPAGWGYGDVEVGTHWDKIFVVSNPGSGVLDVSETNIMDSDNFSIEGGGGSFALNPGEICEIVVRFTPSSGDLKSAVLSLANNVTGKNPLNVGLEGNGTEPPPAAIEVAPDGWSYGEVEIGAYVDKEFAIFNPSPGILEVTNTGLSDNSNFSIVSGGGSFTVNPGGVWEIIARFAPDSEGSKPGILIIDSNALDNEHIEIPLEGDGILPIAGPEIVVEPASWNYGNVFLETFSSISFVIHNPGGKMLEVIDTTLIGDPDFSIEFGGGSFNLNPGEISEIMVRFMPKSTGQKFAILLLINTATAPDPLDIPIQGNGVEFNNSIPLEQGWNFISLPLQPPNTSITSVLSPIQGKNGVVYYYEYNPGWKSYRPNAPQLSDLWDMAAGKGYWIFMLEPADMAIQGAVLANRSIPLNGGWNPVGFSSIAPIHIVECMASISDELISVWEYDPIRGWSWYVPDIMEGNNLTFMKPGNGYWIQVESNCIWNY